MQLQGVTHPWNLGSRWREVNDIFRAAAACRKCCYCRTNKETASHWPGLRRIRGNKKTGMTFCRVPGVIRLIVYDCNEKRPSSSNSGHLGLGWWFIEPSYLKKTNMSNVAAWEFSVLPREVVTNKDSHRFLITRVSYYDSHEILNIQRYFNLKLVHSTIKFANKFLVIKKIQF